MKPNLLVISTKIGLTSQAGVGLNQWQQQIGEIIAGSCHWECYWPGGRSLITPSKEA